MSTDLTNDSSYTVSWWARHTLTTLITSAANSWMIGQGNNGTAPTSRNFHSGFTSNKDFNHAYWSNDQTTLASTAVGATTVGDIAGSTSWNFYALTYNAATNVRSSFINGVQINSAAITTPTTPYLNTGSNNSFYVGARRDGTGSSATAVYNGLIDDVKVYDNAVDQATLAAEYASIIPEPSTGLLSGLALLLVARRRR